MCPPVSIDSPCCAAEPRLRLQQAPEALHTWDEAAADYAATSEGRHVLTQALVRAEATQDHPQVDRLTKALRHGAARYQDRLHGLREMRASLATYGEDRRPAAMAA